MEALIGLVLVWLVWLISSRRWRRRLKLPIIISIIAIIMASPLPLAVSQWGLTMAIPRDTGETADAIVVLGRGDDFRDSRIAEAWQLWKSNRAPLVFTSGMLDARPITQVLRELGIPAHQSSGEECSQSTEENALFTAAILHPNKVQKILLVTDTVHMLRASLVFKHFGFQVIPVPVDGPTHITHRAKFQILLREYAGLVKYGFNGLFKSRSLAELEKPPAEVYKKIVDWNCIGKLNS